METKEVYTKEELRQLGILFFEECYPKLEKHIKSCIYYNNPPELGNEEFVDYSNFPGYNNFAQCKVALEEMKKRTGPMNIDSVNFYNWILSLDLPTSKE